MASVERELKSISNLPHFREWLSNLNRPRKAWSVPLTPRYFETLKFYTYITKTVVVDDPERYDELYKSIVLPTASFEVPPN